MQNKTKKKMPLWLTIIQIVLLLCVVVAIVFYIAHFTTGNNNDKKPHFYDTEAVWTCDTLTIETFGGEKPPTGTLKYLGKQFKIEIQCSPASDNVDIIDTNPPDIIYQHIFKATAELKGDELHITIIKNYFSLHDGDVYILKKQQK